MFAIEAGPGSGARHRRALHRVWRKSSGGTSSSCARRKRAHILEGLKIASPRRRDPSDKGVEEPPKREKDCCAVLADLIQAQAIRTCSSAAHRTERQKILDELAELQKTIERCAPAAMSS
jgi:hypothetical protein